MPEAILMPHAPSSTSMVETSNRIEELREYMDRVNGDLTDGFSDTESSSDDDSEVKSQSVVTDTPSGNVHKAHHKHHRHGPYHKKGTHHSHIVKHRHHAKEDKKKLTVDDHACKTTNKDKPNSVLEKENARKSNDKESANNYEQSPDCTEEVTIFTYSELEPIIAGQCTEDVDTPIMTPPPTPDPPPKFSFPISVSGFYRRPFSLSFFHVGETLKCGFNDELGGSSTENLKEISESIKTKDCFCSGQFPVDEFVTGWDRTERNGKLKGGKKRKFKNSLTDTPSFLRLTGAQNPDRNNPLSFQYHEDFKMYMEKYRFFHTVGNVCRPVSDRVKEVVVPVKRDIDSEPYFKNLKTQCAMATECDLYSLISNAKLKKLASKQETKRPASARSNASGNEKNKSEDEDSNEEGNVDTKPFSMRDRGKTLNLAPVRECMVPDLLPTDKFEQYQQNYIELNQYLNLMTPPAPGKDLQFRLDMLREKRFGNRILNSGDNNLFPACTPRRGARPLRLGSAEFVKPGSGETEPKWSNDVKPHLSQPIQRASTFHSANGNTVPGNLIVGSTVNQSKHSAKIRPKHGGKSSPYVTFSKEQSALFSSSKPQTPPHHISGKRFKPCERVNDLTSSKDRLGRIPFTTNNTETDDKMITPCRTVMAVDLKDANGFKREKLKQITLDVNHLGIRGKTFQQDGQITILYKDRQTAAVKS